MALSWRLSLFELRGLALHNHQQKSVPYNRKHFTRRLWREETWTAHLTRIENNDIIEMLTFELKVIKEAPSMIERWITVRRHKKSIFLKIV